jgi:DNA (cytosine-5)-methyltransferase 1
MDEAIGFHHTQTPISGGVSPALSKNAMGMGVMSIAQNQRGEVRETEIAPSVTRGGGKPGEGYSAVRIETQAPTLTKYNMDSRSPQSEEQQRILKAVHETTSLVRRLTPVECERLQGWPDGWTLVEGPSLVDTPRWFEEGYEPDESMPSPDNRRYAACGDGVTATVAEWLGRRLKMVGSRTQ